MKGFLFILGGKGEEMKISADDIYKSVGKIRAVNPLIHNITNYVAMNNTANALLAIGASPVMAHAAEEVKEMTTLAQALVINIGTLSSAWVRAMGEAFHTALKEGLPVIIDPVGAGATAYRTRTVRELLDTGHPAMIRGNASEIMSLADDRLKTKGVDSRSQSDEALRAARSISEKNQCVVVVSGAVDYVVEGQDVVKVANGHPLMTRVTGLGCTASALCGAFAAVEEDALSAAVQAMALVGIAGELAVEKSAGPGSLQMHFLDCLYNMSAVEIQERLKVEVK